jgi:polyvinyl alcohol dehydrogenase (cytochrome)
VNHGTDHRARAAAAIASLAAIVSFALITVVPSSAQVSGESIYRERCATCHEQVSPHIPPRSALQDMSASRILRSLDFGAMMTIAYPLRREERVAVANFLGRSGGDPVPPPSAFCANRSIKIPSRPLSTWNGWSPDGANTRFQEGRAAGMTSDDVPRLGLKWAFAFDGDVTAFAQPTVMDRFLFVGSAGGVVHALNVDTGCLYWIFQAAGPVRSAILVVPERGRHALLFGDQTGWFYSLEAETGRLLWKKRVEEHEATRLTGAPVAHNGTVFVPVASWEETRALGSTYPCCTFRGSVVALRVRDGTLVWKTYLIADEPVANGKNREGTAVWGPSGAPVWSSPTVDEKRGLLYVTTGDNYSSPSTTTSDALVALHLSTGRIVWSKQTTARDAYNSSCSANGANCPKENGPDFDFGSSAITVARSNGRTLLLAGQKSGIVYAFDPDRNGDIVWETRVGRGGLNGGVQWGMASDGQKVYAAASDSVRTRRTDLGSGSLGFSLDPNEGGGLTALNVETGAKMWYAPPIPCGSRSNCSPAQSAAVTAIQGVVFSGSVDGHLRAYASDDGRALWDFDTVREYDAVNGVKGRGGSLDGPGPVVAGGMLFVNSGYSRFGGMKGNVLLAFAVPK